MDAAADFLKTIKGKRFGAILADPPWQRSLRHARMGALDTSPTSSGTRPAKTGARTAEALGSTSGT